ncbi:MAG: hypothetical protein KAS32_26005 [Candidatus Peribacteraceae bacterium]|nr:hypothetical protein [Candidatus Peribacteraceae bacterium]
MATVKSAIVALLQTDAQIDNTANLGGLLGHVATEPYGIFYMNPPEEPDFPCITYNELVRSGRIPVEDYLNFTVWGGDIDAIMARLYELLHDAVLGDTIVIQNVGIKWNWDGPPIFDDRYKQYTRISRFMLKGVRTNA